jgi:hypothetical protein
MSIYDEKPWLSLYDPDQPAEISLEFTDALSMFRASVAGTRTATSSATSAAGSPRASSTS